MIASYCSPLLYLLPGNWMSFMADCPNYAIDTHIYQAWASEGTLNPAFRNLYFLICTCTYNCDCHCIYDTLLIVTTEN